MWFTRGESPHPTHPAKGQGGGKCTYFIFSVVNFESFNTNQSVTVSRPLNCSDKSSENTIQHAHPIFISFGTPQHHSAP